MRVNRVNTFTVYSVPAEPVFLPAAMFLAFPVPIGIFLRAALFSSRSVACHLRNQLSHSLSVSRFNPPSLSRSSALLFLFPMA
jgi:hypothetical protein